MNPDKVVVHVVDRQRRDVVFNLSRECVRQSCEAANLHSERQILALDRAGRDVLWVVIADQFLLVARDALRAVAAFAVRWCVYLLQDVIVDVAFKCLVDRKQVPFEAVRRQLNAVGKALLDVIDEVL